MFITTYKLLTKLTNLISFKANITLLIHENDLIVQTFFKKDNISYFFYDSYSSLRLETFTNNEELISDYIKELENFYNLANTEDFETRELINQTIH